MNGQYLYQVKYAGGHLFFIQADRFTWASRPSGSYYEFYVGSKIVDRVNLTGLPVITAVPFDVTVTTW